MSAGIISTVLAYELDKELPLLERSIERAIHGADRTNSKLVIVAQGPVGLKWFKRYVEDRQNRFKFMYFKNPLGQWHAMIKGLENLGFYNGATLITDLETVPLFPDLTRDFLHYSRRHGVVVGHSDGFEHGEKNTRYKRKALEEIMENYLALCYAKEGDKVIGSRRTQSPIRIFSDIATDRIFGSQFSANNNGYLSNLVLGGKMLREANGNILCIPVDSYQEDNKPSSYEINHVIDDLSRYAVRTRTEQELFRAIRMTVFHGRFTQEDLNEIKMKVEANLRVYIHSLESTIPARINQQSFSL
ncbi:hypothetical protein JXA85_01420 [Candidatus Woesearchaeota archaeon]|nr:hypothetical protein [Candidatus Woesearchaeota archaeon]